MTTPELLAMFGFFTIELIVVALLTRATAKRVFGAVVAGAIIGAAVIGVTKLADAYGLWHVPFENTLAFVPLLYLGLVVSAAPVYLITWRIARRFGWTGIAVVLVVVALIGPPRDYTVARVFPKWISFGPGIAPIIGVSATYVGFVALGHFIMRLIAGPSVHDHLARPIWNRA